MLAVYVDISSNNGTPNLAQYRDAGYTDLMLKATEGTGYAWDGMQNLARQWHSFGPGYRVGYYHWLYGTLAGSAQFLWFWNHVGPVFRRNPSLDQYGREHGDWMMTDFEDVDPSRWVSDAQHLRVLQDFDGLALQHGWIDDYAPDWYLVNMPQTVEWLRSNNRPVVASDYSHTPPGNRYGLNHVIHQYTDRASVPGMATLVDQNRYLQGGGESTLSNGATQIGDQPMSAAEVAQILAALKDLPAETATAVVNRNISGADYPGSVAQALSQAIKQNHEIGVAVGASGLDVKTWVRNCLLAVTGQAKAMPDGTVVTNLTTAHNAELAAINALPKSTTAALPSDFEDTVTQSILAAIQPDIAAAVKAALDAELPKFTGTLTFGATS